MLHQNSVSIKEFVKCWHVNQAVFDAAEGLVNKMIYRAGKQICFQNAYLIHQDTKCPQNLIINRLGRHFYKYFVLFKLLDNTVDQS